MKKITIIIMIIIIILGILITRILRNETKVTIDGNKEEYPGQKYQLGYLREKKQYDDIINVFNQEKSDWSIVINEIRNLYKTELLTNSIWICFTENDNIKNVVTKMMQYNEMMIIYNYGVLDTDSSCDICKKIYDNKILEEKLSILASEKNVSCIIVKNDLVNIELKGLYFEEKVGIEFYYISNDDKEYIQHGEKISEDWEIYIQPLPE